MLSKVPVYSQSNSAVYAIVRCFYPNQLEIHSFHKKALNWFPFALSSLPFDCLQGYGSLLFPHTLLVRAHGYHALAPVSRCAVLNCFLFSLSGLTLCLSHRKRQARKGNEGGINNTAFSFLPWVLLVTLCERNKSRMVTDAGQDRTGP